MKGGFDAPWSKPLNTGVKCMLHKIDTEPQMFWKNLNVNNKY